MQTNRPEQEGVPIHPGSITSSSQVLKRPSPGTSPQSAHIDTLCDPPWSNGDGPGQESTSAGMLRPLSLRQGSMPQQNPLSPRGSGLTPRSSNARDEKVPSAVTPGSKGDSKGERRTTDSGDHLNALLLGHTHSQIRLRWPGGRSPRNLLVRYSTLPLFCLLIEYLLYLNCENWAETHEETGMLTRSEQWTTFLHKGHTTGGCS